MIFIFLLINLVPVGGPTEGKYEDIRIIFSPIYSGKAIRNDLAQLTCLAIGWHISEFKFILMHSHILNKLPTGNYKVVKHKTLFRPSSIFNLLHKQH